MSSRYKEIARLIDHMVNNKLSPCTLDELAETAEKSPAYIQKLFTEWVGVSPKQFGRYLSLQYAKDLLSQNHSLEKTASITGLSGTSRLHDLFVDIEATTPGTYKSGGETLTIEYEIYESPFGLCLIATTPLGVCNVLFGETEKELRVDLCRRWPHATLTQKKNQHQQPVIDYLTRSEAGERIKLHLVGTNFQLKVWEALLSIPSGTISSYGSIAQHIGQPALSRAVGSAVGDNPIGYIIPCHRVLKATGEISGYRWGVTRKRAMLEFEALKK